MQLTDDQKQAVHKWAAEGLGLTEIQKKINEEFKLALTFMDVRFLIIDLGINLKERQTSSTGVDLSKSQPAHKRAAGDQGAAVGESQPGGGVAVEIDRVKKPGALASGTVTFSDGVNASWMLDQSGRLALNASRHGYKPNEDDLLAFQEELSRQLQSHGF